jgi:hypothetical protein
MVSLYLYGQNESICFYTQDVIEAPISQLSFYVNIENNTIISYAISINEIFKTFKIELTINEFNNFREGLNKFLEWEELATKNKITEAFSREIPILIVSKNVSWTISGVRFKNGKHTFQMNDPTLNLKFIFNWTPRHIESHKGQLDITSNSVKSDISVSIYSIRDKNAEALDNYFRFNKEDINRNEARILLNNLSDERIQVGIHQARNLEQENARQRQLQEELFR